MAEYDYKGCVTGFSESDTVTIWQPVLLPYTVEREDNEYSQRLVDVLLLEKNLPADIGLAKDYPGTGWYKAIDTGIVFCKNVPEGETHIFEGDPKEYISVYTRADAVRFAERAATSNITDMRSTFYENYGFNTAIGHWDVSNVTNMSYMFCQATAFNQDLSKWDVSNVTVMSYMFFQAKAFNQDLSKWDVSNVTNMDRMFCQAETFNQPLNNWDVSNVTVMNRMFFQAETFNQLLDNWDVSNVTIMDRMFCQAKAFNQDLSKWCVLKLPESPHDFAPDLSAEKKPIWGTCPRGENGT